MRDRRRRPDRHGVLVGGRRGPLRASPTNGVAPAEAGIPWPGDADPAIGGELHADEEALLLERGARQADLWGINIYPDRAGAERVEFDALINVRPSQGNRSRSVDDPALRDRIAEIVTELVES